jgi:hypothetical protein
VGTGSTVGKNSTALIRLSAWKYEPSLPSLKGPFLTVSTEPYQFAAVTGLRTRSSTET